MRATGRWSSSASTGDALSLRGAPVGCERSLAKQSGSGKLPCFSAPFRSRLPQDSNAGDGPLSIECCYRLGFPGRSSRLCAFFPFFILLLQSLFSAGVVFGQPIKIVDSRWMVLSHPLLAQFSPLTGRFSETSSEPVGGGENGLRQLGIEVSALKKAREDSLTKLNGQLRAARSLAVKRSLEADYLSSKKDIDNRLEILKARLIKAREVPGRPGLTTGTSIAPQIAEIAGDIRDALLLMRKSFPGVLVDVAPFMPPLNGFYDTTVLFQNRNFLLWQPRFQPSDKDIEWLTQARFFHSLNSGEFSPFPMNAIDGKAEGVVAMQTILGQRRGRKP